MKTIFRRGNSDSERQRGRGLRQGIYQKWIGVSG
jgi:hypothetical protein